MELVTEEKELFQESSEFTIYTHARKSRLFIMGLFFSYFFLYTFLSKTLLNGIKGIQNVPYPFAAIGTSTLPDWFSYTLMGATWLGATFVMFYFLWMLVDIWGLQVSVSDKCIIVVNTVSGSLWADRMGLGMVEMENITEVRGSRTATYISDGQTTLRISPVERIEQLIQILMKYAVNAEFKR